MLESAQRHSRLSNSPEAAQISTRFQLGLSHTPMITSAIMSNITSHDLHLMHFVSMTVMPHELAAPRVEVHPRAIADELFDVLIDHEYQP